MMGEKQTTVALSRYSSALFVLALFIISWMNIGVSTFFIQYIPNYLRYGVFLIWFCLALISSRKFANDALRCLWPLYLFVLYVVIMQRILFHADVEVYLQSIVYLIMVYSIYVYYSDNKYLIFQKYFYRILLFDYVIVGIKTFFYLKENPLVARYLSTDMATQRALLGTEQFLGVGTYGYFYSLVSLVVLFLFFFLYLDKKSPFYFLFIAGTTYLIVQSRFTLAILLLCIFGYLVVRALYLKKYVTFFLVALFVVLVANGFIAEILSLFSQSEMIPIEVSIRIHEISRFLSGLELTGTDLGARFGLYMQSLNAFGTSAILGTFGSDQIIKSGGHSTWLDLLASFGIFATLVYYFFYKCYFSIRMKYGSVGKQILKLCWLYYLYLGLINVILSAPIFVAWLIFLPFYTNVKSREDTELSSRLCLKNT